MRPPLPLVLLRGGARRVPTAFLSTTAAVVKGKSPRGGVVCTEKFGVAVGATHLPGTWGRPGKTLKDEEDDEVLPRLIAAGAPVVHRNLDYAAIRKLERRDGLQCTAQGAMAVDTGVFTGRSPQDKYVVDDCPDVWWGAVNQPMERHVFDELQTKVHAHLGDCGEVFVFDGYAGAASPAHRLRIRVVTSEAWQHHFCRNMFVSADDDDLLKQSRPDLTVYAAPAFKNRDFRRHGLRSETFVALDLGADTDRQGSSTILIGGTHYAGEIKKGVFSVMNYAKPRRGDVLTMHCAATVASSDDPQSVALFFGLSGTGKTTLSTGDPRRSLIGDDEHGWDDDGVWNIEGGCYAKTLNLDPRSEPSIYAAIKRNALLENVAVAEKSGVVDYASRAKTPNGRVSYPLTHVENRVPEGRAGHPTKLLFLTCDAFGVLPPVARLTPDQALYHFLSGFTAKVAGTERGLGDAPTPTFSACFGAAFLPLHPARYAELLRGKMRDHGASAYLVNTGWIGGPSSKGGRRIDIATTRNLVAAVLEGGVDHDDVTHHPVLNLDVPNVVTSSDSSSVIDANLLHPWASWSSRDDYERAAADLAAMFVDNFEQYVADGFGSYAAHGPQVGVGSADSSSSSQE
mmetsp:Transcript_8241/g.33930  ORF Transcript_8241/g.33930 Transcript_8241/m.33930 type:complete len:626 (-) Transcript_8241:158-2035(-)